jgi:CRISPR-associated exonuclease Cas4
MLGQPVVSGALFYGQTRRRKDIVFDDELRALTRQTIIATRDMIASGKTPLARYEPRRCDACSLIDLCQPRLLSLAHGVDRWLRSQLED